MEDDTFETDLGAALCRQETIQAGLATRVEEREAAEAARKTDGGGVREDDGGG